MGSGSRQAGFGFGAIPVDGWKGVENGQADFAQNHTKAVGSWRIAAAWASRRVALRPGLLVALDESQDRQY